MAEATDTPNGVTVQCRICGGGFPKRSGKNYYCKPCAVQRLRDLSREHEARKRRAAGKAKIGDAMPCISCGTEIVRDNPARRRCPPCKKAEQRRQHRAANQKYEKARPAPRKRSPEERARAQARYNERHPEADKLRSRKYNQANRELINAKARARNKTAKRQEWRRKWEAERGERPGVPPPSENEAGSSPRPTGRKGRTLMARVGRLFGRCFAPAP